MGTVSYRVIVDNPGIDGDNTPFDLPLIVLSIFVTPTPGANGQQYKMAPLLLAFPPAIRSTIICLTYQLNRTYHYHHD